MAGDFVTIEEALAVLKQGKMIILVDDEHRENEGDLVIAADFATSDAINFMSRFGRGLICLPMAEPLIHRLQLPMMAAKNGSPYGTAFTVSIEAATGVSTGISAADRAKTIEAAIKPNACPEDIISPGHVFPLVAKANGVLERQGQTEGSVDLMKLASLSHAAVICEIMNDDGQMSRRHDLALFSKKHQIPMVSIRDLIDYRLRRELTVEALESTNLPLKNRGDFTMTLFRNQIDNGEHIALIKKSAQSSVPLVRIHSECITGDVFGSCRCDCGEQLQQSLDLIAAEGGILIYLRQEGRGIGLLNKLKAYNLQEQGLDTVDANLKLGFPADNRDYAVAYQMLKALGVDALRLLTNNPKKIEALLHYGLVVQERIPLTVLPSKTNRHYLQTKKEKLGHLLELS